MNCVFLGELCVFLGELCVSPEFRLAVVQLHVTSVKADNLSKARRLIREAAGQGSKVVVLPVSGGGTLYMLVFIIFSFNIMGGGA